MGPASKHNGIPMIRSAINPSSETPWSRSKANQLPTPNTIQRTINNSNITQPITLCIVVQSTTKARRNNRLTPPYASCTILISSKSIKIKAINNTENKKDTSNFSTIYNYYTTVSTICQQDYLEIRQYLRYTT